MAIKLKFCLYQYSCRNGDVQDYRFFSVYLALSRRADSYVFHHLRDAANVGAKFEHETSRSPEKNSSPTTSPRPVTRRQTSAVLYQGVIASRRPPQDEAERKCY